jgi:hypothetical protein
MSASTRTPTIEALLKLIPNASINADGTELSVRGLKVNLNSSIPDFYRATQHTAKSFDENGQDKSLEYDGKTIIGYYPDGKGGMMCNLAGIDAENLQKIVKKYGYHPSQSFCHEIKDAEGKTLKASIIGGGFLSYLFPSKLKYLGTSHDN